MEEEELFKKKLIHSYIIALSIVIVVIIVGLMMLKYHVEGETNLPFNINQISIISTVDGTHSKDKKDKWYTDLSQRNDIYFYISKNPKYIGEAIRKITFDNFSISKNNEDLVVEIYKQKDTDLYEYVDEYIVNDSLEYVGDVESNAKELKMNNQGGLIGFSVLTKDVSRYYLKKNEKLALDGTLLKKTDVNIEDIKIEVVFDVIIETELGNKVKTTISLKLPGEKVMEEGVVNTEITDLSDIVFKRV